MPHDLSKNPKAVVKRFNEAWIANDLDQAMSLVAEKSAYALYISSELLPQGGETVGRDNIRAALAHLRAMFEYILYRPHAYTEDGDVCRYRVEFMYRHRTSGEVLSGNFRVLMTVRDGLLVRADEYHDRAMVETFMRLFAAGPPTAN